MNGMCVNGDTMTGKYPHMEVVHDGQRISMGPLKNTGPGSQNFGQSSCGHGDIPILPYRDMSLIFSGL